MCDQVRASRDDWNAHWERYAESARDNPAQLMRHHLIAGLLSEGERLGRMRILDLGSGQGDLLERLGPLFPEAELAGVELSEKGLAISQRKVPRGHFFVADILNSSAPLERLSGWATHAVCSEVLEHVDNPAAFLECAGKYLAGGARLIVTVPRGPMSAFDRHIGHRQHFGRGAIRSILERAGYKVERTYLAGFPFFNLYRLLVIARGKKLAEDIEVHSGGASSALARAAMKLFRGL